MIFDKRYWAIVIKRIVYVIFLFLGVFLAFKLAIFYMPFLIAFIIALLIEPLIKIIMNKTNLTRRTSAIIIFTIVALIILGVLTWLILTMFSEASNLLNGLNEYIDKIYKIFNDLSNGFNFDALNLPEEIKSVILNSTNSFLGDISIWAKEFLNSIINIMTLMPVITIYFGITVIALYLISVDRIYILDQIEHHLPPVWLKKLGRHFKELTITLGGYLKAQVLLILVSFVISILGLYIFQIVGFEINYPLLIALLVAFVDALPILGSGTVMIPWAVICAINGNINLAISIILLLILMSVVRQILEPKLVSKHIGIHPIFTLIAMYTGFKFIGVIGLIAGPIMLIILKNVFATFIDKGMIKSIFEGE